MDGEGISAYCGTNEAAVLTELYADQKMLGLEQAVQYASEAIASQVKVEVSETEFVYVPISYHANDRTLFPCWRFEGTNVIRDEVIIIYVDAFTGELYYYTMAGAE